MNRKCAVLNKSTTTQILTTEIIFAAFFNFEGVMGEAKNNDWNVTVIAIDPEEIEQTLEKVTTANSKNIFLYCLDELVCGDVLDKV